MNFSITGKLFYILKIYVLFIISIIYNDPAKEKMKIKLFKYLIELITVLKFKAYVLNAKISFY